MTANNHSSFRAEANRVGEATISSTPDASLFSEAIADQTSNGNVGLLHDGIGAVGGDHAPSETEQGFMVTNSANLHGY